MVASLALLAAGVPLAGGASASAGSPTRTQPAASARLTPTPEPTGVTKAPLSQRSTIPRAQPALPGALRGPAAQQAPSRRGAAGADRRRTPPQGASASATAATSVPAIGRGVIPWHGFSTVRLDDSLVAQVDLAYGSLFLQSTDFDIPVVGRSLQWNNVYNSIDGTTVSNFDRHLGIWVGDDGMPGVTVNGDQAQYSHFRADAAGVFTTDEPGYRLVLVKNADGTYTLTRTDDGSKDTYAANGDLTATTDRNGGAITIEYHTTTTPGGFTYNTGMKVTDQHTGRWVDSVAATTGMGRTVTDHAGRTVTIAWPIPPSSQAPSRKTVTDVAGKTTTYDYDADERVTRVTTPEGRRTAFTYDADNWVTSVTRVTNTATDTGQTTLYDWGTTAPWPTTVTDAAGHATRYESDDAGAVVKVTDALGNSRSATYDGAHNTTTAVDAMGAGSQPGNTATYGWDTSGNLTTAQQPLGATAALNGYASYSGAQRPGGFTSAHGTTTAYTWDTVGNLKQAKDTTAGGTGAHLDYTYQGAGTSCGGFPGQRCTATDANGKTTTFAYDGTGNLTSVTPPAPIGATTYTYDDAGRTATAKDGRGITATYTYDAHNRVRKVATPGASVTYAYDGDGNLTTRTDPSGTTTYTYDKLGRENWRRLATGEESTLAYDTAGNVATHTDAAGIVAYAYDNVNRLTFLTQPGGASTAHVYDNNNRRTSTTFPGGAKQTNTWDNNGRPASITATANGGAVLSRLTYAYTTGPAGTDGDKASSRTDAAGRTTTYTYDSLGRLTRAVELPAAGGTPTAGWLYCHDPAGNLTSTNAAATATSTCAGQSPQYGYNNASQLTSTAGSTTGWSYDGAGNETAGNSTTARTNETYTDLGQPKTVTTNAATANATYSGTDASERTALGATTFSNTALGVTRTQTSGAATGFVREPTGKVTAMTRAGQSHYYTTDAQGSITTVVDATGAQVNAYTYTPYGAARTTTETVAQPWRYTGAHLDATGLYKMGARSYDPTLGRFTQPDPSGQESNPYSYVAGDPVNHIDPTGLKFRLGKFLGGVGSGIVAVAAVAGAVTTAPACVSVAGCVVPVTFGGTAIGSTGVAYDQFSAAF